MAWWLYAGESNNKKYNRREGVTEDTGQNISIEENQGWISISLGLKQAPDSSLWEEIE